MSKIAPNEGGDAQEVRNILLFLALHRGAIEILVMVLYFVINKDTISVLFGRKSSNSAFAHLGNFYSLV